MSASEGGMVSQEISRLSRLRGRGRCLLLFVITLAAAVAVTGCGGKKTKVKLPPPIPAKKGFQETGKASWYGHPYHGRRTANGEKYNMNEMTAAHLRLPFDTWVEVKNLDNGRMAEVRINDRGPFAKKRIIDLSRAAAKEIGMLGPGTAKVRLKVIAKPGRKPKKQKQKASKPARGREVAVAELPPQPPVAEPSVAPGANCPPGPYWAVQVGAFRSVDNARRLSRKLNGGPEQVRLIRVASGESPLYRVVVAAEGDGESATQIAYRLNSKGIQGFSTLVTEKDAANCL